MTELAGATSADRDPLLRALLRSFEEVYGRWQAGDDAGVRAQPVPGRELVAVALGVRHRAWFM